MTAKLVEPFRLNGNIMYHNEKYYDHNNEKTNEYFFTQEFKERLEATAFKNKMPVICPSFCEIPIFEKSHNDIVYPVMIMVDITFDGNGYELMWLPIIESESNTKTIEKEIDISDGYEVNVERPTDIVVSYMTIDGIKKEAVIKNELCRKFLQIYDTIEGISIRERAKPLARKFADKKYAKRMRKYNVPYNKTKES